MRRDRRTFLQRIEPGPVDAPVRRLERATRGVGWCSRSRGRPPLPWHPSVVGLSDSPVLLFAVTGGSFTVLDARARAEALSSPGHAASHLGLAFGVPAEPSRIRPPHGARDPASPGTSSLFGWPISRCPRERPLQGIRRLPSADGCHSVGHAPSSWFSTTSTVSSVHGSRRVAAGTGSGFARFRPGRSSKPKLLGPGPASPLARHPAKVCSSSAAVPHHCGLLPSCRSSPARSRDRVGFAPTPSEDEVEVERLDPSLPAPSFPTGPPDTRSRRPAASRRWACCSGAPSVRSRAGCPALVRGVRLDRVGSPVARLWLARERLTSR
jgi:hypothetical protein